VGVHDFPIYANNDLEVLLLSIDILTCYRRLDKPTYIPTVQLQNAVNMHISMPVS